MNLGIGPFLFLQILGRRRGRSRTSLFTAGWLNPEMCSFFWYLKNNAAEPTRVAQLEEALADGDLQRVEDLIAHERAALALRNDDVAILRIAVKGKLNKADNG
jgi:hypothetical protein